MAIRDLNELEFVETLQGYLTPSSPVQRLQLLRGRREQVTQITRAFHSKGRHVFIFGDRGVGKSSLALSVANFLCAEDDRPIQLACNSETFFSLARNLASQLLGATPVNGGVSGGSIGLAGYGLSATLEGQLQAREVPELTSLNEVVSVIRYCVDKHLQERVVIFDEFDALPNDADRGLFADFIKQMGDQSVPIKMLFTGIGQSLESLLAAHHSCYRYLASVSLSPLNWDGRLAIINAAAEALGIEVDMSTQYRIGAISDGFPHYIHLICEKLFWEIFDDPEDISQVTPELYRRAIEAAVQDIEPFLQELYETATRKYNDDYQEVLWAVADHHEFERRSTDIFLSYQDIMKQRPHPAMDRTRFNTRMNSLKKDSHGAILIGTRQGWYELREPILRGYIRLRAERDGVALAQDHPQDTGARTLQLFKDKRAPQ
ncbi:ATP-binding protein [Croceicoccus sp. Ery15]|uniref:ATP-binding protein n=1 Tax=Croceicoccus sp. Ery15 TaxID=1703338 RepID=UPI001E3D1DD4|nr:ATP-binding protein [Croceicoccus sp. Ery15]